jgi:hypothetical protein
MTLMLLLAVALKMLSLRYNINSMLPLLIVKVRALFTDTASVSYYIAVTIFISFVVA